MRAVSISDGFDMNRVVKAAAEEIESNMGEHGLPEGAFLVMSVKFCRDEQRPVQDQLCLEA